jgi:uncharacterized damage-inducible protein DinB
MAQLTNLELAREQLAAARRYTLTLLDGLDDEDWLRHPHEGVTHIAWQVGHLAMAEYGLCLFRIRGRRPEDLELMPSKFRKQFSRGSTPALESAAYPSPAEIRHVFDRIHEQALQELADCRAEVLDEKIEEPYAVFDTKLGALFFCAHHEMLHAGQIGLIRRLIGKSPVR